MSGNHVLDGDHCVLCGIKWRGLTERDIQMLTTAGKCRGKVEMWVPCQRYPGQLCLGEKHEECRDE